MFEPRRACAACALLAILIVLFPRAAEAARATHGKVTRDGDRFTRVEAIIKRENLGGGTATNSASRVYVRALGCTVDDAGHIIAKRLGGRGGRNSDNIFPQYKSLNRGIFKDYEAKVFDLLQAKDPKHASGYEFDYVKIIVTFNYGDRHRPNRPTQIHYRIDGERFSGGMYNQSWTFRNTKPDPCYNLGLKTQAEEEFKTVLNRARNLLKLMEDLSEASGEVVEELSEMICELDIEERSDQAVRTAERAAEQMRQKIERNLDKLEREYKEVSNVAEDLLDDEYVGDASEALIRKLYDSWGALDRLLESKTYLTKGRSSPIVQAKVTHGWRNHARLLVDRRYACDRNATNRIRGADCVSLAQCTVWEFGPDSDNHSKMITRARRYVSQANSTFKSRPEAAHCWDGGGKGFRPDRAVYKACKP